jgi:hypothetical protein
MPDEEKPPTGFAKTVAETGALVRRRKTVLARALANDVDVPTGELVALQKAEITQEQLETHLRLREMTREPDDDMDDVEDDAGP